jgi:hypothetical protein
MIKKSIIKEYLKEFPKNYLTFDIKYTKKESDYLDNFNIKNISEFHHYGNIDQMDDKKLNDFLNKIGDNENINILNKIIHKLTDKITDSYNTKYCWMTIRVSLPDHKYDIPRWHKDGKFFKSDGVLSKFVTVLKGPGTLFIKESKKVNDIYDKNNEEKDKSYIKNKVTTSLDDKIETKYRKILAKKFKKIKQYQLESNQGLIFVNGYENNNIGFDKNNNKLIGLMHSEPKNDTPRIFISILPGSQTEIMDLQKKRNGV